MSIAVNVEHVGKKYLVNHRESPYPATLREVVTQSLRGLFSNPAFSRKRKLEDFWALRDVSFQISEGERVGVVGRNGAGKSTLLKILSMVTEPTTGRLKLLGRVGSLLEVGTGFHPELSGRENIFLNGAILGMSKQEIRNKFDEIIEFAEIDKFLDTPVKRYSTGMYVRLAFAVAAHLDPDILIVDEALAVGDLQFQKKCITKMNEAGKEGRTVIFVSHNMQAVKQLCTRGIVLQDGEVAYDGSADAAVEAYIASFSSGGPPADLTTIVRQTPADPTFRFTSIELNQDGKPVVTVENGKPLEIITEYDVFEKVTGLRVYFDLCDRDSTLLMRSFHDEDGPGIPVVYPGHYRSRSIIPANFLGPIPYLLIIRATIFNVRELTGNEGIRIELSVEHTGSYNRAYLADTFRGKIAMPIPWQTEKLT